MVEAVFAVVAGSFGGVPEDVVCGGDPGKAFAGFWVGAVAVWVVAEGEGVEFSVRVGWIVSRVCGVVVLWVWDGLESKYFLISAALAVTGRSRIS